jgi:hypothetical protein
MYTAPYPVFAIEDYEAKYYTLLRLAAGQNISCIATVNPSTVLLLGDRLARHSESIIRDVRDGSLSSEIPVPQELRASLHLRPDPERARHLEQATADGGGVLRPGLAWPELAAIGCWKGGTVGAYLAKFDTYFPQRPPVRDMGYYATELRGSVPSAMTATPGPLRSAPTSWSSIPPATTAPPKAASCSGSSSWRSGGATSSMSPAPRGCTATT